MQNNPCNSGYEYDGYENEHILHNSKTHGGESIGSLMSDTSYDNFGAQAFDSIGHYHSDNEGYLNDRYDGVHYDLEEDFVENEYISIESNAPSEFATEARSDGDRHTGFADNAPSGSVDLAKVRDRLEAARVTRQSQSAEGLDLEEVLERIEMRRSRLKTEGYVKGPLHLDEPAPADAPPQGEDGSFVPSIFSPSLGPEGHTIENEDNGHVTSDTSSATLGRFSDIDGTSDLRLSVEDEAVFDQDIETALGVLLSRKSYGRFNFAVEKALGNLRSQYDRGDAAGFFAMDGKSDADGDIMVDDFNNSVWTVLTTVENKLKEI